MSLNHRSELSSTCKIQSQTPSLITPSGQAALLPQTITGKQQPLNLQNNVGANAGKVAKFLSGWQQVIIACVVLVCITVIVSALVIGKLINPILGLEIAVPGNWDHRRPHLRRANGHQDSGQERTRRNRD